MNNEIENGLEELLLAAEAMSTDIGASVKEILQEGLETPLSPKRIREILTRVVEVIRKGATRRNDHEMVKLLDSNAQSLSERIEEVKAHLATYDARNGKGTKAAVSNPLANDAITITQSLWLQSYDGVDPSPVRPTPVFHERPVAVNEGFVRTRDIELWDDNSRLDIHLNQFNENYGRNPNPEEVLSIMKGEMPLQGIATADQFGIEPLAKSIAVNGVRKPPIIDVDGTLLDGNRRVTACYRILEDNSGAFTPEEKQRAEWMKVWQLTEHATDQDREAVIVSLNFEPDFKQDWPEYVKAQKVHDDWGARLALEPRGNPGDKRLREIRTEIARKFALATNEVSRYINMVSLAREFEEHHVVERSRDLHAVKHRTSKWFQYFDELNKGRSAGGVRWSLNQDSSFKQLVFDLLYEGKFRNWRQIRDLKLVYSNDDATKVLRKAREQNDIETAQEDVDNAIGIARVTRAETRQTAANTKIRIFTDWFLDLPVKAFDPSEAGCVTQENLKRLWNTLKHVEIYLEEQGPAED